MDGGKQAARVARLEKDNANLRKENAVTSGPNTPSGSLSLANILRRRFRAIAGRVYRDGAKKGSKWRAAWPQGALQQRRGWRPLSRPRPAAVPRLPRGPGGCQTGNERAPAEAGRVDQGPGTREQRTRRCYGRRASWRGTARSAGPAARRSRSAGENAPSARPVRGGVHHGRARDRRLQGGLPRDARPARAHARPPHGSPPADKARLWARRRLGV